MPKSLATVLSYIFHPLLGTTYVFYLLLNHFPIISYKINEEFKWQFVLAVFIITFIIPGLSSFILKKTGYVSSLEMENRKERRWPFAFTIVIYMINTFYFYRIFQQNQFFTFVMLTITVNIVLLTIISFWWKVSVHASAVGGILAFYIVCSVLSAYHFDMYLMIILLLISGAVMSSRLALNVHSFSQVVVGFFLGLSVGISSLYFLI